MEEASPDGQFTPGKTYARKGQVVSVTVQKGVITGTVQGAPVRPHDVSILIGVPDNYAEKVAKICRERPVLAAKILAGEMTKEMEKDLRKEGVHMFSYSWPIEVRCDCYNWITVCKHAASLCYVLAEEIDHDSSLYWKMLGVDLDAILQNDTRIRKDGKNASLNSTQHDIPTEYSCVMGGIPNNYDTTKPPDTFESKYAPPDLRRFWGNNNNDDDYTDSYEDMGVPTENAAILKRLGGFPMWRGTGKFLDEMEDIYKKASTQGAQTYTGMRAGLNMKSDTIKRKRKKT